MQRRICALRRFVAFAVLTAPFDSKSLLTLLNCALLLVRVSSSRVQTAPSRCLR